MHKVQYQIWTDATLRPRSSSLLALINGRVERCLRMLEMANDGMCCAMSVSHLSDYCGYVDFCIAYLQNISQTKNPVKCKE